jgi:rod shape-determining protein MreC
MKKFGLFILNIKEYLVLSFCIITCLILIFSNNNTQIKFLRAAAVGFMGTMQSGISTIPNVFELEKENKFLREENIRLSNEVSGLKEGRLENIRLTKLLGLKEKKPLDVASAKVINKSLIQTRNTITLNVGENDGIKINMPVVTDAGLVGRIIGTSGNYSIVQILYNKELKLSVKCQRSRIDGILNWNGIGNLAVSNVPKSADVNLGDMFVTSEYSNTFPPGIPVGYVTESGNLDNLFKKINLESVVNFNILEEVFILKSLPDKERQQLESIFLPK